MTIIIKNPRERTRFLRFAFVGIVGAIVDFGVMNLFRNLFLFPLVLSGTISFVAAIINNFLWNRYWTYPDSRSKSVIYQLLQFSLVSVGGLIIRVPILKFVEPVIIYLLKLFPFLTNQLIIKGIGANITLAIAILIVMLWNFLINRYWTYNDVK